VLKLIAAFFELLRVAYFVAVHLYRPDGSRRRLSMSDLDGNRTILDPAQFVLSGSCWASPLMMRELGRRAFEGARRFDRETIVKQEVRPYEQLAGRRVISAAQ
jgi:hypothetical protein